MTYFNKEDIKKLSWVAFVIFFLLCIFKFYLWTSFQGKPVIYAQSTSIPSHDYYSRLTDAFWQGHLYFLDNPPPQLLALPDPYNPVANAPYRLDHLGHHDLSLYHGKWYMYFGITPILLLWLPLRIIGYHTNYAFATALFCWLGLLGSLGFLRHIVVKTNINPSRFIWVFMIMTLALTNAVPFLLRRSLVYETAISAGYCCFMLALYFFASGCLSDAINKKRLFCASLFLGLAVGARPNFILAGWLLPVIHLCILKYGDFKDRHQIIKTSIALWAPYLCIGCGLALYNDLRFHSIFNFGFHYQLAIFDMKTQFHTYSHTFLLPNLYFYVLQPLYVNAHFPFFHVIPQYPGHLPTDYIGPELVTGMLSLAPILWALPLLIPCLYDFYSHHKHIIQPNQLLLLSITGLLIIGLTQLIFLSFSLPGVTMRYLVDFIPYFLMATLLMWCAVNTLLTILNFKMNRMALNVIIITAILYGTIANMAIGLTGYNVSSSVHSHYYKQLEYYFRWNKT